ncbi:MAG TPA: hypothetical protein VL360_07200 [Gammaproteobacteria bacterium]|jgi:hypothetical protein|nr:hypothetical protein [Gammaproteobacteria bacterium]
MKDSRHVTLISISILALTLSACSPYRPGSGKAAYCNQLNSQIVFSGSTADTRKANLQAADEPMVVRTFDKDGCA